MAKTHTLLILHTHNIFYPKAAAGKGDTWSTRCSSSSVASGTRLRSPARLFSISFGGSLLMRFRHDDITSVDSAITLLVSHASTSHAYATEQSAGAVQDEYIVWQQAASRGETVCRGAGNVQYSTVVPFLMWRDR